MCLRLRTNDRATPALGFPWGRLWTPGWVTPRCRDCSIHVRQVGDWTDVALIPLQRRDASAASPPRRRFMLMTGQSHPLRAPPRRPRPWHAAHVVEFSLLRFLLHAILTSFVSFFHVVWNITCENRWQCVYKKLRIEAFLLLPMKQLELVWIEWMDEHLVC
jgi:hypothetical protein